MESCDLDLDKLFDISRFDYTQWMQQVDTAEDESCGSAAIRTLMSTYDIFRQLRYSAREDTDAITALQSTCLSDHGVIDTVRVEDPTFLNPGLSDSVRIGGAAYLDHVLFDNNHGRDCTLADAGRPVLGSASEIFRDYGLSDGRIALAGSSVITCENYDERPENLAAEGINEQTKAKRRGSRRHRNNLMKKPMGLTEIILELLDIERRENALRCLSGHMIERRETDTRFYRNAAYQLYYSCSTLAIFLQEVTSVYERIFAGDLSIRGSKRLANVLTCFQSIASSDETRIPFVRAKIPNFLLPFILSTYTEEVYENVRAISLSIINIACKDCEREVIQWALESDIVQACLHGIEIGSRLSKLIAMSILEAMLHDEVARGVICRSDCNLIVDIVKMLSYLAAILGVVQDFSRRLIFQVVRCYTLLCQHPRALELVKDSFPDQLQDHTFRELKKVYPLFRILLHQLLLCIGKVDTYLPQLSPSDSQVTTPTMTSQASGKENVSSSSENKPRSPSSKLSSKMSRLVESPLRPVDLNKKNWHNLPPTFDYVQLVPYDRS